jgi:hypothetical protein
MLLVIDMFAGVCFAIWSSSLLHFLCQVSTGKVKIDAFHNKLLILAMQHVNLTLIPFYPGINGIELWCFFLTISAYFL